VGIDASSVDVLSHEQRVLDGSELIEGELHEERPRFAQKSAFSSIDTTAGRGASAALSAMERARQAVLSPDPNSSTRRAAAS
jgi:hypothetical protein